MFELRQRDALRREALDFVQVPEQLRAQALHRHPLPAQHALLDAREGALAQVPDLRADGSQTLMSSYEHAQSHRRSDPCSHSRHRDNAAIKAALAQQGQ